jgi:hypothetical protein
MALAQPTLTVPIEVQVSGDSTPLLARHAEQRLRRLLHATDEQVRSARIRLVRYRGPRATHSIVAQANLVLRDRSVRAQVVDAGAIEAVAALLDRLHQHLRQVTRYRRDPRMRHSPAPHRSPRRESARQRTFSGPHQEIVRRKAVSLTHRDVDEAAFDMDIMDYDFHLFVESGTGEDSVLYRMTPTERGLSQLRPSPQTLAGYDLGISIDERPAPRWDVGEAVRRLSCSRHSFLFFQDGRLGRGAVVYRRYDGHFGLITPAWPVRPQ